MRKIWQKLLFGLAMVICISVAVGATPSSAAIVDIGGALLTGSWQQRFQEGGIGTFTKTEAFVSTRGVEFKGNGFESVSINDWSASWVNPGYAVAAGGALDQLQFNLHFTSMPDVAFSLDFLAWDGDHVKEAVNAQWTGIFWSYRQIQYDPTKYCRAPSPPSPRPVPEPETMLLLGSGLIGIAGWGRKKFHK